MSCGVAVMLSPVNSHLLPRHYRDISSNLKSLIKPKKLCRPISGLGSGGWVTTGCVVFSVFTAICVWCLSVITKYINFLLTTSCSYQIQNLITQNTLTQPSSSSWPFCDHLSKTFIAQNWEYNHLHKSHICLWNSWMNGWCVQVRCACGVTPHIE